MHNRGLQRFLAALERSATQTASLLGVPTALDRSPRETPHVCLCGRQELVKTAPPVEIGQTFATTIDLIDFNRPSVLYEGW